MTTKTNYRAALQDENLSALDPANEAAIRRALLIAERVEREPSDAMYIRGSSANVGPRRTAHGYIFETMRDQLLAEVDAELEGAK